MPEKVTHGPQRVRQLTGKPKPTTVNMPGPILRVDPPSPWPGRVIAAASLIGASLTLAWAAGAFEGSDKPAPSKRSDHSAHRY